MLNKCKQTFIESLTTLRHITSFSLHYVVGGWPNFAIEWVNNLDVTAWLRCILDSIGTLEVVSFTVTKAVEDVMVLDVSLDRGSEGCYYHDVTGRSPLHDCPSWGQ